MRATAYAYAPPVVKSVRGPMNSTESNNLPSTLQTLFRELLDGPDATAAWMLNAGDAGLLRSLDT